jgi:hypothetical protein
MTIGHISLHGCGGFAGTFFNKIKIMLAIAILANMIKLSNLPFDLDFVMEIRTVVETTAQSLYIRSTKRPVTYIDFLIEQILDNRSILIQ